MDIVSRVACNYLPLSVRVVVNRGEDVQVFDDSDLCIDDPDNRIVAYVSRAGSSDREQAGSLQEPCEILLIDLAASTMLCHHCGKS